MKSILAKRSTIAPANFDPQRNHYLIGDKYIRILTVKGYPNEFYHGLLAEFINNVRYNIDIKIVPSDLDMATLVKKKSNDIDEKWRKCKDPTEKERLRKEHDALENYIKELVKVLKNSGYIHFGYKDDYDNELKDMLTAMISECGVADMASAYICQGLMLRILWRLGTVYEYAQSRYIRKKINWLLHQEITDFIEDNMKDVTIDMLVERFGYQEDYFNRFLKAQTGMTFTEYLQDCRLNKSAILLKEDSMDVDEIIKEVGYRNKGYFYRIFTEKYNMTPAKFRKYIKEKEFTI